MDNSIFNKRFQQLTEQPKQKAPAHYWQEQALKAMEELKIDRKYVASVMRAYKRKPERAEAVRRNMAGKTFKNAGTYFLKMVAL